MLPADGKLQKNCTSEWYVYVEVPVQRPTDGTPTTSTNSRLRHLQQQIPELRLPGELS